MCTMVVSFEGVSRWELGLVSLGLHCFLRLCSYGLIVFFIPGCCWAYSAFSVCHTRNAPSLAWLSLFRFIPVAPGMSNLRCTGPSLSIHPQQTKPTALEAPLSLCQILTLRGGREQSGMGSPVAPCVMSHSMFVMLGSERVSDVEHSQRTD